MIKLVDLLLEFPMKIDNAKTVPELMERVLSMPTLSSQEMLSATSKIKEEGIYFWYLTPEGAERWEEVLSLVTGKPQTVSYCKTNDEGNYLVYVGITAQTTGLEGRFAQHIGTGNPRGSTVKKKIFQILFPNVDVGDDYTIFQKNIKHGGGQYYTEYKGEFDKFIEENFRFNFIKASELDLDKDLPIKAAVEKIEGSFISSCVLHLNGKSGGNGGVPEEFKKYQLGVISPSKTTKIKKYTPPQTT